MPHACTTTRSTDRGIPCLGVDNHGCTIVVQPHPDATAPNEPHSVTAYMAQRANTAWVCHVGRNRMLKIHFIGACAWTQRHLDSLGQGALTRRGEYCLGLVSFDPYLPGSLRSPRDRDLGGAESTLSSSRFTSLSPTMSPGGVPRGEQEDLQEDDCGGDVEEAELRVYQRIMDYMQRSNLKTLFQLMNKKGDGVLNFQEWRDGMIQLVGVKASGRTLKEVFKRMETGNDHLGRVKPTTLHTPLYFREFSAKAAAHEPPLPRTPHYLQPHRDL